MLMNLHIFLCASQTSSSLCSHLISRKTTVSSHCPNVGLIYSAKNVHLWQPHKSQTQATPIKILTESQTMPLRLAADLRFYWAQFHRSHLNRSVKKNWKSLSDSQVQHKEKDSLEWKKWGHSKECVKGVYLSYSKISSIIKSKSKSHNRIFGDISASATWQLSWLEW